jgi:hypothetical protein
MFEKTVTGTDAAQWEAIQEMGTEGEWRKKE